MTLGTYNRHQAQRKKQAALAAAFPQGIRCQKCLQYGHWSYECTGQRKILTRPSRTQILKKNLKAKDDKCSDGKCNIPAKKKRYSNCSDCSDCSGDSSSGSSSDSSSSDSGSDSGSDSDSDSSSGSDSGSSFESDSGSSSD